MPNFIPAAAEIFLISAICLVLLIDVFLKDEQRRITLRLSILAIVGVAACSSYFAMAEPVIAFNGSVIADPVGNVLKMFVYIVVALTFLYSRDYLIQAGLFKGEFFIVAISLCDGGL